jgi:membrane glycosyltransferase
VKDKPNMVNINLQINSNAGKKSLQQLVKKYGSHKKYVTVQVDAQQDVTGENMDRLQERMESEIDKIAGL